MGNKYYVTMNDKFMSGWGRASDGLINKLIFICDSFEEAEIVEANARNRNEMKYINICSTKPAYMKADRTDYVHNRYYVQIKTKEDYPRWYKRGAF